jgi:hypothetical protein
MLLGDKIVQLPDIINFDNTLPPIPPSEGYTPLTGKFTILIKLDYLNLPFEKNFEYRYALWGNPAKIYFQNDKSSLKITSSLQSLSKYLWDMSILCI